MIFFNKNSELRNQVKTLALKQRNKPYVWGSLGPDSFDCAGLTWYLYKEILGVNINEQGYGKSTTTMQMTSEPEYTQMFNELDHNKQKKLEKLNIGDIIFFHRNSLAEYEPTKDNYYPGHCGIYLGENSFIHAPKSKGKIVISNFCDNPYWVEVWVGSRDVISSYLDKKGADE